MSCNSSQLITLQHSYTLLCKRSPSVFPKIQLEVTNAMITQHINATTHMQKWVEAADEKCWVRTLVIKLALLEHTNSHLVEIFKTGKMHSRKTHI